MAGTRNNTAATTSSVGVCFVAGTKINTGEGIKPIETVRTGDKVWAQDEKTGHVALKEVVRAFRNETSELVKIQLSGEQTTTTPEHPFYAPTKGWTEAVHLRAGDKLLNHNGEMVVVEQVQHEILEAPVTVYNFEVADYHTYFVGTNGVLVHNSCDEDSLNAGKLPLMSKREIKSIGGEAMTQELKAMSGHSRADLRMKLTSGNIYAVPKGKMIGELVGIFDDLKKE